LGPSPAWLLAILLVIGSPGCGDSPREQPPATTAADAVVDASGWLAFKEIGLRITGGEQLSLAELAELGEQPAFTRWRQSNEGAVVRADRVGRWLEAAFADELGRTGPRKINADRRELARSYRYSFANRDEVDRKLNAFIEQQGYAQVLAGGHHWIGADRLPRPLKIDFLPAKPEIRFHDGRFLIDTGVLAAGGTDQLIRNLISLLYRNLGVLPGASPLEFSGEEAVAQSFRVMLNEGIASWLDDEPRTYFLRNHYKLKKVNPVPEDYFNLAIETIERFEATLPPLFADPAQMQEKGLFVADGLAGSGAFTKTGFSMATTIARRLGAQRLHEVRHSIPGFLAAYQEAARLNPQPLPQVGTPGQEAFACMPPLTEDLYQQLHDLLVRHFPQ
jgi:hypothetical protein